MFDRRVNDWTVVNAYLFSAQFDDGLTTEIQVNPEFGSTSAAASEAARYGRAIGQLPTILRTGVETVWIHQGDYPFGGGNNNILIHVGLASDWRKQFLEEALVHEGAHTSLDARHATTSDWIAAQEADGNSISTYARDYPGREDIAESFLSYLAVRYRAARISRSYERVVLETIPNRIAYFDAQFGDMYPIMMDSVEYSGDDQQGAAGAALSEPFVVEVSDQSGSPLAGAEVTFAVTAGGGTLSIEATTTDADGRAAATLTLGSQAGTNTVQASVGGLEPVTFTATGTAVPRTLDKPSGDEQVGEAGAALREDFVVEVRDQNGAALSGVVVTFAVITGGGTLSVTTATTDAEGRAATTLTLGRSPGTNTVEASVAGLEPVTFTVTGLAVPRAVTKLPGYEMEGPAGTALSEPFVVEVRDQNGQPLAGVHVAFSITAGSGALSATTAETDADGQASTTLTLGSRPETVTVEASVPGLEPVTFTATARPSPDFDGDGEIGFSDFFLFAQAFGGSDPRFDLDGSGAVDLADFLLFSESFGQPARARLVAMARERIGLPDGPQLRQNAPNPFNSQTVISWFQLQPGPARLEVFALTGQRVAVLHQGPAKAGLHHLRWDGRDDRDRPLASGVYLYRLMTAEGAWTRKLTSLK